MRKHAVKSRDSEYLNGINGFVCSQDVKQRIGQELGISLSKTEAFPSTLILGPSGSGKTELAKCLAFSLGEPPSVVMGAQLKSGQQVGRLLGEASLKAARVPFIFIDECHEMPRDVQTIFFTVLSEGRLRADRVVVPQLYSGPADWQIPETTFIFATTDSGKLLEPLKNRFKITITLRRYDVEDLAKIAMLAAKKQNIDIGEDTAKYLALRARGVGRVAVNYVDAMLRYREDDEPWLEAAQRTMKVIRVDSKGLTLDSARVLRYLLGVPKAGVDNMATVLGIDKVALSQDIEPHLVETGMIIRGPGGRAITPQGRAHILANMNYFGLSFEDPMPEDDVEKIRLLAGSNAMFVKNL